MKVLMEMPDGMYEELKNGEFPLQEANRVVNCVLEGSVLESLSPDSDLSKMDPPGHYVISKKTCVPHWEGEGKLGPIPNTKVFDFKLIPDELMEKFSCNSDIISLAEKIMKEYDNAVKQEWIDKPLSYALYKTWKECDLKEKGRHPRNYEAPEDRPLYCRECKNYKAQTSKKGRCVLRCVGNYQDIRYGSTPACRKNFERREISEENSDSKDAL